MRNGTNISVSVLKLTPCAHRNLDDGTHIVHHARYQLLDAQSADYDIKKFIPAHKDFRVIAIAAPVPPYTGYPLDPPFRSRFQARYMDPLGVLLSLKPLEKAPAGTPADDLFTKLRTIVLATQYASETKHGIDLSSKSMLPAFPQTALVKLRALVDTFPPPYSLSPTLLAKLVLAIHPGLLHAQFVAWAMLSKQTEDSGLGTLGSLAPNVQDDSAGFFGYRLAKILRVAERAVRLTFEHQTLQPVETVVPGGPLPLLEYPWLAPEKLDFTPSDRFIGLLTSMLQAHALKWDIALEPPVLPSTASCSTSLLVRTFGAVLGYEVDSVHLYKELGGRELVMRRRVEEDGSTTWEPR